VFFFFPYRLFIFRFPNKKRFSYYCLLVLD